MLEYTKKSNNSYTLQKNGQDYLNISIDNFTNSLEIFFIGTEEVDGATQYSGPYQHPLYQQIRNIPGVVQTYVSNDSDPKLPEFLCGFSINECMLDSKIMGQLVKHLDIPYEVLDDLYPSIVEHNDSNIRVQQQQAIIAELLAAQDYNQAFISAYEYAYVGFGMSDVVLYDLLQQYPKFVTTEEALVAYSLSTAIEGLSMYSLRGARYLCEQELNKDLEANEHKKFSEYLYFYENVELVLKAAEWLVYSDEELFFKILDDYERKYPESYLLINSHINVTEKDTQKIIVAFQQLQDMITEYSGDPDICSRDKLSSLEDFATTQTPTFNPEWLREPAILMQYNISTAVNTAVAQMDHDSQEQCAEVEDSTPSISCKM